VSPPRRRRAARAHRRRRRRARAARRRRRAEQRVRPRAAARERRALRAPTSDQDFLCAIKKFLIEFSSDSVCSITDCALGGEEHGNETSARNVAKTVARGEKYLNF
jgi:hypothetical protein